MAGRSALLPPSRRPNYRFGFTAFADTMFQLLIFFLLSSSLTPYSLLTVKTTGALAEPSGPAGTGDAPPAPATDIAPPEVALWTVEGEALVVGGQRFTFDRLPALADALGTPAAPANVVLIVRSGAKVQDVATVLAALQAADVGTVRIAAEGG